MNDINANGEVSSVWRKFIHDIFNSKQDPVRHCELYKNEDGKGSCPHVDGMLCDYPCDMLKKYRAMKTPTPSDQRAGASPAPMHRVVGCEPSNGENP